MGGVGDQTLVKELCLLRLPEVFLRHCPCFPPLFGRSDGQIIAGEEMFGASGTFMLLILQSFTAAAPPIYTNATKRGELSWVISAEVFVGGLFCGKHDLSKFPLLPLFFSRSAPN